MKQYETFFFVPLLNRNNPLSSLFPPLPASLQVCPSWYHVSCSWQDCRDGQCWQTVCQSGKIHSLLYRRTRHPWRSCAARHLLHHYKEEPIHLPLGNIHSPGNGLWNKLQVMNSPPLWLSRTHTCLFSPVIKYQILRFFCSKAHTLSSLQTHRRIPFAFTRSLMPLFLVS